MSDVDGLARQPAWRIRTRPGHPDFLDLPWQRPLETWEHARLVQVARGVSRHVVRFVDYDGVLYALKELPARLAQREYALLRRMAAQGLPVVDVVGVVSRRRDLDDVLLTRYLDYSLPYRVLFAHRRSPDVHRLSERLLDALAVLLVRLHLGGFFWGDCSLSNTLFRRDAGALAAYLVDAETGEWHPQLTDGQRALDLEVTELNVAGGLLDVQAQLGLPPDPDPVATAEDLRHRYERLWAELTTTEVIGPDERFKVEARMRRLNELGFDVDEVEFATAGSEDHRGEGAGGAPEGGDQAGEGAGGAPEGAGPAGQRLILRTQVTEQGFHRRRLFSLTGLQAQENQARSLLNDLANFRSAVERDEGRPLPEQVVAYRWLTEVFEPTVAAIPESLRAKLEPVEVFHEVVEHKWFLSEVAGADVGVEAAVRSYMDSVLPEAPDERAVLSDEADAAAGWIGYG